MDGTLLTLHILFAAITIGVLFVESLAMVMVLRLPEENHREGARRLQLRIHRGIYYPALVIAIGTGFLLGWREGALAEGWLAWMAWKLVLVVLLAGLGLIAGQALQQRSFAKPAALLVHLGVLALSAGIVALAALKPF
jgi:uncharacterized membrane protein